MTLQTLMSMQVGFILAFILGPFHEASPQIKPRILGRSMTRVRHLRYSPNGRVLAISDVLRGVELLDTKLGQSLFKAKTGLFSPVTFSADGNYFAFGDEVYDDMAEMRRGRVRCL